MTTPFASSSVASAATLMPSAVASPRRDAAVVQVTPTSPVAPAAPVAPVASATPTVGPTGPQILSVVVSPAVIHAGEAVVWDVRTTGDIVRVAANVTAYHLPLQRAGRGHFVLNFTVPSNVPGFFHGTYALDVRGETAQGASASRRVSLVFQ